MGTDAQMIAEAMARFTGEIKVIEGFTEVSLTKRSERIDPETKLKRKPTVSPDEFVRLYDEARRKGTPKYEYGKTIKELAAEHGLTYSTLQRRLQNGMTLEQAVGPQNLKQRRLTDGQVRAIRANKGVLTAKKLAERYAVHIRTIEQIWSRKTWKGVV